VAANGQRDIRRQDGSVTPERDDGRVDAHHHIWDLDVRDQPWIAGPALAPLRRTFTIDDLADAAHAASIDSTVLVETIGVPEETPELLDTAAAHELVAGVIGWIDLTARNAADALAALREPAAGEHLVGIRHQVQSERDPEWLCRPDVRRGLQAVAQSGLAYDLLTVPAQLPAAIATVRALPELTFVVDHLSKPPIASGELEPWATQIRTLASHENVVCKLSGMVTEADWITWTVADLRPFAETALEAFGAHRLMFGSDWPVCQLAASYSAVVAAAEELAAELSADEHAAVFGGTARRTYDLPSDS
jgi:L-fuconolactonase